MLNKKTIPLLIAAMFLALPSSAASDSPAPIDATASWVGPWLVDLEWSPAPGSSPDSYRVYLDGSLHATTNKTLFRVERAASYAITAVYGITESQPVHVLGFLALPGPQASNEGNEDDGECQNFPILIQPNTFPYLFVAFQEDCYNWLWYELGFKPSDIVSKIPPSKSPIPIRIQFHT